MSYLLDTCLLPELVKPAPEPAVLKWVESQQSHQLFVSGMTIAELQRGISRLPESTRRAELTNWVQNLEEGFEKRILPFDADTARVWASIMVAAERLGKPLAAFDSIIAATASKHQLQLITRNVRDFSGAGVALLNPWPSTSM